MKRKKRFPKCLVTHAIGLARVRWAHDRCSLPIKPRTPLLEIQMSAVTARRFPFCCSRRLRSVLAAIVPTPFEKVGRKGNLRLASLAATRTKFSNEGASRTLNSCWSRTIDSAITPTSAISGRRFGPEIGERKLRAKQDQMLYHQLVRGS